MVVPFVVDVSSFEGAGLTDSETELTLEPSAEKTLSTHSKIFDTDNTGVESGIGFACFVVAALRARAPRAVADELV